MEELYQVERAKFDSLTPTELREYIVLKTPKLRKAIERVPAGPRCAGCQSLPTERAGLFHMQSG